MKLTMGICLLLLNVQGLLAQQQKTSTKFSDSLHHFTYLPELTLVGKGSRSDYQQMPEIVGTNIYAGKKSSLVVLENVQGNVANNTMRQVLAKVPGIHIWESDPSGIQVGIAARGLSPNRSWEFNVRQNGYDISADPFGYPEAYYNPPLQAVQRIEVVRGQGSLQYGPQFGGMVNYIIRNGSEITLPEGEKSNLQFETEQTIGSNALFHSYNAVGGKSARVHYYAFFDHRNGNGYRENSRFYTNAGFGTVTYKLAPKWNITVELMQSHIRSQQPGGLTDIEVETNSKQSFRSRNWFYITWTNPAISLQYDINDHSKWITKIFATIGNRNSVGYLQSILVKDSINPATGEYNNRVLNIDQYRNYALESRVLTDYRIGNMKNTLAGGIRLYTGETWRRADGKGTTGTEYDMSVIGNYGRDIRFRSRNAAAFVENIFRLSNKILLVPGIRYEWLEGAATGRNGYNSTGDAILLQDIKRSRSFVLAGIGAEYHVSPSTEIYASYAQAYRPIQFANLQAPPTRDIVDPDLKDAKGYNADLGYRGRLGNVLTFDLGVYYLQYDNRVGTISYAATPTTAAYRLITNVGASTSKGFEGMLQADLIKAFTKNSPAVLNLFAAYSYTDASYNGDYKVAGTGGKKVENAPKDILRCGIGAGYNNLLVTGQVSYVGESFSDANNTIAPTANAQTGVIPSYMITDLTASYKINKYLQAKAGVNNLFDKSYFTRRAGGYPGPGAMPGDGRTIFVSVAAKF